MGRRNKVLKNVKIEAVAAEGRGLARHEGKVVFVDYGIPGDVVDVRLTRNKKDFAQGVIMELHEPSDLRQASFCKHFWHCGGCRWQHISYDQQLAFKDSIVEEAIRRTGKQTEYERLPIMGCDEITGYRNKFEFTFSQHGWFTDEQIKSGAELERRAVGFHVAGQYQRVVNVEYCHLQDEGGNAIRNAIYKYALENNLSFYHHRERSGFLRNLILRYTSLGERMILLSFGENDPQAIEGIMNFITTTYPDLDSVNYVVNTKGNDTIYDLQVINYAGKDHIIEKLGEVSYRIGSKSFFQTNSKQAKELYDVIVDFAGTKSDELVYDLYTGIGSIALYVANACKKVVGVETVPEAIEDAWKNAALNATENVDFVAGSSERVLSSGFLDEYGRPDVVITDPPRAGMHKDVVEFLLMAGPKRIVYVSCNPVTQARDILMLSGDYKLIKSQPVDMFPHTYHVENVVLLERKS
ncbi:MAG: 23S rRNA (uracil(1939)-C(5))-methyltransferase RlmD [Bacteroidetes bacterium]|nr:23S rRNA (uracil(1939)-C(5))-methyltransferase RlmD [Bacteroidota bacterium]